MAEDTLTPVTSSLLESVGYDAATRTLSVRFKTTGARYRYTQVPPDVFDELRSAESAGQYFNQKIKGQFSRAEA